MAKVRAPRNRTLSLTDADRVTLRHRVLGPDALPGDLLDTIILGDSLATAKNLPRSYADLLFLDLPYNLNKRFGGPLPMRSCALTPAAPPGSVVLK
jgi:site-specific DNA-methyltransferase (adenine-specific)